TGIRSPRPCAPLPRARPNASASGAPPAWPSPTTTRTRWPNSSSGCIASWPATRATLAPEGRMSIAAPLRQASLRGLRSHRCQAPSLPPAPLNADLTHVLRLSPLSPPGEGEIAARDRCPGPELLPADRDLGARRRLAPARRLGPPPRRLQALRCERLEAGRGRVGSWEELGRSAARSTQVHERVVEAKPGRTRNRTAVELRPDRQRRRRPGRLAFSLRRSRARRIHVQLTPPGGGRPARGSRRAGAPGRNPPARRNQRRAHRPDRHALPHEGAVREQLLLAAALAGLLRHVAGLDPDQLSRHQLQRGAG